MDVAVDNTFATPLLQRPLDAGADVVVHSATKLLSGHSDLVLGAAVTRRPDIVEGLRRRRSLHGAIAGPWEAWLALRGIRTLAVRLAAAQANAAELATRLVGHPAVERVRYPGLAGDPGHERARQQMKGFGTMVTFEVAGGADTAEAVASAVRLITAGTSLGGVETLSSAGPGGRERTAYRRVCCGFRSGSRTWTTCGPTWPKPWTGAPGLLAPGTASVALVPAGSVPVAAQVRGIERHDDHDARCPTAISCWQPGHT